MASYTLENCLFEKSGTQYNIDGIKFTTSYGVVYCAPGTIRPDNCADETGAIIGTSDVTEDQAKVHLQWMANDFETRGCGDPTLE